MDWSGEREEATEAGARQVLFIQGGGAGAHDAWDTALVDSLREALGAGYEVRYPRMPREEEPSSTRWGAAIWREVEALDHGAVVAGHSIGGTLLVQTLVARPPERRLAAIVLLAAPFVGPGGWPGAEFEFSADLGDRLPGGVPVLVFHGAEDRTAPPRHAELYGAAIPQSQVHLLPGRDHQLNGQVGEVALSIRDLPSWGA